ncbi:MAG: DUF402 domain-containing protein [Corynebacteriales bacterium]|nr:DUF402 domain-containing protein [Mycobacteriales bacterium]
MDWKPGDTVLYRYIRKNEIRGVRPTRVVEANDDYVLLWQPAGVQVRLGWHPDGAAPRSVPLARRFLPGWTTTPAQWQGTSVLYLMRPGAWHSLHWFFNERGFSNWYVNVETPGHATAHSWDTDDLELDVVVQPDLSWRYKDEDEFAAACHIGAIDPETAQRAQQEADKMARQAARGAGPFDGRWVDFAPDPAWPVPALADHWSQLHL